MTTYKPGDRVLVNTPYFSEVTAIEATVLDPAVTEGSDHQRETRVPVQSDARPDGSPLWFRPSELSLITPTFRPGDVVEAADGRPYGELGAVVHVSKKGRWATVQYDDGVKEKWLASELRLSYRPATAEEMLTESEELRAKMVRGIEQEKSNRIAAQYANDQALLAAGLVRVDLLKQWAPTFTERTREPQYALLQRLRSVLADDDPTT